MTTTKIKNTILLSIALIIANGSLYSQTATDGLRFSQTINGGTARFVSMGGAFGALGADFSSLSVNPAGLGVYKSSELTITPSFKSRKIESTYDATSASDSKNRLGFDNFGFVMSFKPYKSEEKGIVNFNIGFGYTRTNDFYSNSYSTGGFNQTSIMDFFTSKANSLGLSPSSLEFTDDYDPFYSNGSNAWDIIMGWNTYLLFDYDNGSYFSALLTDDLVSHKNSISTQGGSGEYDFSFAMNISNKLFLGATLGITNYSYTYNATYSEDASSSNLHDSNGDRFYFMDYYQFYETTGSGYNLKIGALYTPIQSVRIGASIHTPTFYSFDDSYSSRMETNFDRNFAEISYSSKTPLGRYDYSFESPFKAVGSFAYIIQNIGLISLDVEHIDYSSMKFRDGGDGESYNDLNVELQNTFKSVTNLKIGGEYRIADFALRAGYAYYPSPYKKGFLNEAAKTTQVSGGFGYRSGNFSIDMAYLRTLKTEKYKFYDHSGLNPVNAEITDGRFLVTLGFRF